MATPLQSQQNAYTLERAGMAQLLKESCVGIYGWIASIAGSFAAVNFLPELTVPLSWRPLVRLLDGVCSEITVALILKSEGVGGGELHIEILLSASTV